MEASALADALVDALAVALADERAVLLDVAAEDRVRLNAALDLYQNEPQFLVQQLRDADDVVLLRLVLEAVTIRAGKGADGIIAAPVFALAAGLRGAEIAPLAEQALAALLSSERDATTKSVLPLLLAALAADDPAAAAVACRALGNNKAMAHVPALLDRLEKEPADSAVATAAKAALESILMISAGPDAAAWRAAVTRLGGKRRDEVLEGLLVEERNNHVAERARLSAELEAAQAALIAKDAIILRLKIAADESNPAALLADLTFDVAAVRRFAAETLRRRADEWEVHPARAIVIERLQAGIEPPSVISEFLYLLQAIDAKTPPPAEDPVRDAVLVRCLGSSDGAVISAATVVAEYVGSEIVTAAILSAVERMGRDGLPPEARTSLLRASGTLGLIAAKDVLIRALRTDESVDVRQAAINALGQLELPETTQDVAYALKEDLDWRVRRRAATVLPLVAHAAATPLLIHSLADARAEVRIDVITALAGFPGDEAVVTALAARLPVEEEGRGALLRTLGELGSMSAVPAIVRFAAANVTGVGVGTAGDDTLWRDARAAISALVKDDAKTWAEVVDGLQSRPQRAAWALAQRARALEASGAGPGEILLTNRDRARCLLRAGLPEQAADQAEKAIAAATGEANVLVKAELEWIETLARARVARAAGRGPDAVKSLRELVARMPSTAIPAELRTEALVDLVEALISAGETTEARALFSEILIPDGAQPELQARVDVLRGLLRPDGEDAPSSEGGQDAFAGDGDAGGGDDGAAGGGGDDGAAGGDVRDGAAGGDARDGAADGEAAGRHGAAP